MSRHAGRSADRVAFEYWHKTAPETYAAFLVYVAHREGGGPVNGQWQFEHQYWAYRRCFPERLPGGGP